MSGNRHFQRGVLQREMWSCVCCGFSIALCVQCECTELKKTFPPFSFLAILRGPKCFGSLLNAEKQFQAVQKQSETLACSPMGWLGCNCLPHITRLSKGHWDLQFWRHFSFNTEVGLAGWYSLFLPSIFNLCSCCLY